VAKISIKTFTPNHVNKNLNFNALYRLATTLQHGGCEVQIGFFKNMIEEDFGHHVSFTKQFDNNTILSFNPLMGMDWYIWRNLSLSAELRLPFERIRYADKGVFIAGGSGTFDNGTYNNVGFGKPICSFQIGYQF
jgi:hypothetical protein